MPTCAKCGQDNPDVARFCLACGSPIEAPATVEERKLITVVFIDIVGSTAAAETLDPEDVRARLSPYYVRVRAELERFGGTVEKFIGDAVVALFGAPVAHEDDPERAVRAALAVRGAIDALNAEDEWLDLKIRVGVNTGEALVVVGARASEGEGMAAGDVMNTAARLQSAAPVNGILVGELTYDATRDCVEYREAPPIEAKGKREPVAVWEAIRDRVEQRRPARSDLVGRDADLSQLEDAWNTACTSRAPVIVTVLGAPGLGKTRLVEEFADRIGSTGAVHWGRCLPYGEGITYWPISEVLKSLAGLRQSDDSTATAAGLGALLEGLASDDIDELRTIAAAASNVLGTEMTPRGTYSAAVIGQAELHWGIRRLLQLASWEEPLLLVFEDLHWAEPTLLELLRYLVSLEDEMPLLIVGTGRPELAESDPSFARTADRARTVALDALPDDAGAAMLEDLLGDADMDDAVRAALLRNAGGNPLFLEETVRMLSARETVLADGEIPVPTTLQSLIAARLDQLPVDDKRAGQRAAVIGRVFWPGAVAHVSEDDVNRDAIRGCLDGLERRDFVHRQPTSSVAGEVEYAFKHILIRDVAYGQLPKGQRVGIHLRCAEWVSRLPGADEDFIEIVAWHLEQSCRLAREVAHSPVEPPRVAAADALARAAEKAERREGLREANRFYERALDVLQDVDGERTLELRLQRARTLALLGNLKSACEELISCDGEAAARGRDDVRCDALVMLANIDQRQGRAGDARTRLDKATDLAARVGDPRLRIRTAFSTAALRADYESDVPGALAELQRALELAERAEERTLAVEGHLRLGYILFNTGDFATSERELSRCYDLAEALGSRRDQARATFPLGLIKHYRGESDEAERLGLQAREWLDRTAEPYFQIQNLRALGLFALVRGDLQTAEERFQAAIPIALEERGFSAYEVYRWLVEVLVRQGRIDDARELVTFAERGIVEEDRLVQAYIDVARALVAGASGEERTARELFAAAITAFEELDVPIEAAETRICLGRAFAALGNVDGAQEELGRARDTFARMHAVGATATIDDELTRLRGADEAGPTQSASS